MAKTLRPLSMTNVDYKIPASMVYLIQTLEYNADWVEKIYKELIAPFLYKDVVQKHVNIYDD